MGNMEFGLIVVMRVIFVYVKKEFHIAKKNNYII